MMKIDAAIQKQVDDQLLEQGAFTVLELLLATGRLAYSDYESWRRQEIEFLDGVLMGSPEKIRAQIEQSVNYARSIGLVEQPQEFTAWHSDAPASNKPLRISAQADLHRLIAGRFIPAQQAPQMDLFFDNPVAALTNGIARALAEANVADAQRQVDRLYEIAPTHSDLAGYDRLIATLSRLDQPIEDPREALKFLLDTAPTAKRLLGSQYRELLTPLWRQLADALADQPFSADEPQLHRSFALSQAQDWAGVSACVLEDRQWWRQPALCLLLAQSGAFQHRRVESLTGWFALCWHAPATAAEALSKPQQPDAGVGKAWQEFLAAEDDLADDSDDRGLAPQDFPAWMLLHEPGLARQMSIDLARTETPGEEHYRCVHRWLEARRTQKKEDELAQRKILQAGHPLLFRYLKSVVG
ncbi:hypothetical protein JM946_00615 [Steroidobacter sp. S1-65]|uniref:Uncharacterized protein n=1 Tax=Steroidobacter gossypii TaxID=2805490 RepID=A0ABS1WQJ6_9GAMM|nr:hypothetical protein [Steroidobacter gossypii]MBM0103222.1 hypothetical protein [Steroidobacter gossypii]